VTYGQAEGVVVATGDRTEMGRIWAGGKAVEVTGGGYKPNGEIQAITAMSSSGSAGFQPAVSPTSSRQSAQEGESAAPSSGSQAGSAAMQQTGSLRYNWGGETPAATAEMDSAVTNARFAALHGLAVAPPRFRRRVALIGGRFLSLERLAESTRGQARASGTAMSPFRYSQTAPSMIARSRVWRSWQPDPHSQSRKPSD
jgi:hypothetical protein